jgi:hypothetical protein
MRLPARLLYWKYRMIRAEFAVAAIALGTTVAVAQLDAFKEYCTSAPTVAISNTKCQPGSEMDDRLKFQRLPAP